MIIEKTLKMLIEERGVSITHMARLTKVPKQTIHNWLTGVAPRNIVQVKAVADYFHVSLDYLCFGIECPHHREVRVEHLEEDINAGVFEVVLRRVKK